VCVSVCVCVCVSVLVFVFLLFLPTGPSSTPTPALLCLHRSLSGVVLSFCHVNHHVLITMARRPTPSCRTGPAVALLAMVLLLAGTLFPRYTEAMAAPAGVAPGGVPQAAKVPPTGGNPLITVLQYGALANALGLQQKRQTFVPFYSGGLPVGMAAVPSVDLNPYTSLTTPSRYSQAVNLAAFAPVQAAYPLGAASPSFGTRGMYVMNGGYPLSPYTSAIIGNGYSGQMVGMSPNALLPPMGIQGVAATGLQPML
jgi:hypothetical protein